MVPTAKTRLPIKLHLFAKFKNEYATTSAVKPLVSASRRLISTFLVLFGHLQRDQSLAGDRGHGQDIDSCSYFRILNYVSGITLFVLFARI